MRVGLCLTCQSSASCAHTKKMKRSCDDGDGMTGDNVNNDDDNAMGDDVDDDDGDGAMGNDLDDNGDGLQRRQRQGR